MDLEAWLAIAGVCATGAVFPGPSLAVVLRNTVAGGRGRGVGCAVGHALGVGIYAFVAVAGLRALVEVVVTPVTIAGSLYLVWLGVGVLRATAAGDAAGGGSGDGPGGDATSATAPRTGRRRGFAEGFLIAFLNPKVAVFFLALMGSLVPPEAGMLARTGVATLAMVIDGTWYVLVATVLAGTGAAERLDRGGVWIGRAFGLLLVGLGAWILVRTVLDLAA